MAVEASNTQGRALTAQDVMADAPVIPVIVLHEVAHAVPLANAASSASCESNTRAGASTTCRSSGTAETLITARPMLPCSSLSPPVAAKGAAAGRSTLSSPLAPAGRQASAPGAPCGIAVNSRRPPSRTVSTSSCIRPASSSSRIT
jgi:2-dehydro-3-deoxyphosphogluconate aldolase / (4S)-4-hydroxy-2-oxoglutarate aldolase